MEGVIYRFLNRVNGKCYVGQTINFKKRKHHHLTLLRIGKHVNTHLQLAFIKYGEENFEFEILEIVSLPDEVVDRFLRRNFLAPYEQKWMDKFNSASPDCGYNMAPVAGTVLGRAVSEATRKKVSESLKGHPTSAETRLKIGAKHKGTTHTQGARDKMSQSLAKHRYLVTHPDGTVEEVRSLRRFCDLHSLEQTCMRRVMVGIQKQHKGFTIVEINELGEVISCIRNEIEIKESRRKTNIAAHSKWYLVTYPDGTVEKVFNLKLFATQHGLNQGNLAAVVAGKKTHHKGFKVKKLESNLD